MKGAVGSFDVCSTERLLDILGYIPLTITQAAAFINHNRRTVQCYLAALEKDKQILTEPRASKSAFRTWKLSFVQFN